MRPLATTDELVVFWRAHTRQGIALCFLMPLIIVVEVLLTPEPAHPVALCTLATSAAVLGTALLFAPIEAVVRHRLGRLLFDAWDAAGLALVASASVLDGGLASPFAVFFVILLAHAAMANPPVATAVMSAAAIACYVVVGALTGASLAVVVAGSLTLALATGTCAFAAWNRQHAHGRTRALAEQMARLADRDGLTDLLNHRAFHQRLEEAVSLATSESPLSMVIVDVDRFKSVNDTYGHAAGDAVLRMVADVLSDDAAQGAVTGRLGGDEFALFLPATPRPLAVEVAERLCRAALERVGTFGTSLSVGVASATGPGAAALLAEADAAVYEAKRTGRGRACTAPSGPPQERRAVPAPLSMADLTG